MSTKMQHQKIKSKLYSHCIIATSLVIHMLIILSNDIHQNPGPNYTMSDLTICHANIRSLKAKGKFLSIKTELAGKYDIIALSETWLSDVDKSEKFSIPGYQLPLRRDRHQGRVPFGGVLVWVSNKIACKRRLDLESPDLELMWLELRTENKKLYLATAYRSESLTDFIYWERLQENIDNIRALYNPRILICGDLNADPTTRQGKSLSTFIASNNFTSHIDEPTRITDKTATILDQFISNFPIFERDTEVLPPLLNCDHCIIATKCSFKYRKPKPYTRIMWDFTNTNFGIYRETLNEIDWDKCFDGDDINEISDKINKNILETAKRTIHNREVTIRPADKSWFNADLRQLRRQMMRKFKKAKQTKDSEDWNSFRNARREYHEQVLV